MVPLNLATVAKALPEAAVLVFVGLLIQNPEEAGRMVVQASESAKGSFEAGIATLRQILMGG